MCGDKFRLGRLLLRVHCSSGAQCGQPGRRGSCSSGRFADLALAAEVLKGRKIHPGVRMAVTPISARTMRRAEDAGFIKIFADAGAMVTQPGCGSCYSGNLGVIKLGEGERCISSGRIDGN